MGSPIRGLKRSTSRRNKIQKSEDRSQRADGRREGINFPVFCFLFSVFCFFVSGCGPKYTYPADIVPQAIEQMCLQEYKIGVTARVVGKTVGALVYLDTIVDPKGQIPKEVHEKMGQVVQAVTRVALSTDLPIDFCTVVIRDKVHTNELVITRSLDDTKRANADAIGIEESINRTLFGQAKFQVDATGKGDFVLEEVKKESFLTEQIVQRIRFSFAKDVKDETSQPFILVDGAFEKEEEKRGFHFSIIALKTEDPRGMILSIFKIVNTVLQGYQFTDFELIEIQDYLNRQKLVLNKQVLLDYQQKKITDKELLDKFLMESQSIQEAFKLFGFSLPQESNGKEAAVVTSATP